MRRVFKFDFVRFCLVGAIGFTINFTLLTLFYKILDLPIFFAQLIAAEVSLFNNFLLHHHWTYKKNKVTKRLRDLLWQFHVTSWVAIVGSALLVTLLTSVTELNYFNALVISSATALLWNFFWTKYIIWRHPEIELE